MLYFLSIDQCPTGKFSSDGLGPLCRVCPKNSYQDQPGETACKNCEHGTKTLQLAATSAEACGGTLTRTYVTEARLLIYVFPSFFLKPCREFHCKNVVWKLRDVNYRIVVLSSCPCDNQCKLKHKHDQQGSLSRLLCACVSITTCWLALRRRYSK